MKKIKGLLGVFSFVLLGISFTNGKADILPVKNIFPDGHTMMYVSSLSNEDYLAVTSVCSAGTSNFGYSVLTDFTQNGQATLGNSQGSYNTSLFSYISNNVNSYTNTSMLCNNGISSINFGDGSVLFGNCGNNYIGLGKGYLDIDNYTPLNRSNVSFLKLVYLTGAFSNFNMNNLDNSSNTSFDERYAIGKHYSMYNNSYIMDLPNGATRYGIQDLNGFGYSYIFLDTTGDFISWSDLHFATVSNSALNQRISQIGSKSFETLVGGQIVIPQFLELKDLESNNIFFFSKISGDYSSLAYQHFVCSDGASDSIGDVMYGNNCYSSSFGIVPNALPFTDATTPVSKSSLTWFLSYLLSDYPININFNVNQQTIYFYSLGVAPLCENTYANRTYLNYYSFGQFFQSYSSGQSLQMYYLNHYSQTLPPLPSDSHYSSGLYSGSVSLSTCIDTEICFDRTGSNGDIVRLCTTECVSSGVIASGGYIGSDGIYYFVNSPISIEDSLKTDNPENMFTGSYIESGGILSLSYFTDLFQPGAKSIGVCPFKYYEGPLDFMTKLKVGDVYLLMPILCFYSAFQEGKNVTFFDEFDINDGLFSQPLIYGDSKNHKTLFAFFDVLFSIGLLGLIRYLSRHLF